MRKKIQNITLNPSVLILLMLFLTACSKPLTVKEQVSKLPKANSLLPYHGRLVTVRSPQESGYHIRDFSYGRLNRHTPYYGNVDYLVFVKAVNDASIATAFVKSYRLKYYYKDLDANETLKRVYVRAMTEHSQNISSPQYKTSDFEIAGVTCKRIDFTGEYKGKSMMNIIGYDLHCVHPKWKDSTYPYLVRIGVNYVYSIKNERTVLPAELELFFKNVSFISKFEEGAK